MNIPYKAMFNWKSGVLGFSLIGIWYLILPFLAGATVNQTMMLFGFTFLCSGLILANPSPSVIGAISAMLIGLSYSMLVLTNISPHILWTLSLILFIVVLILELGIFKFGPRNSKVKVLTVIPMAILGFSIVLGIAGYNPAISFSWTGNAWAIALNYIAVMVFAWLHVFNLSGYRPFGNRTTLWMNMLAILAVGLSFLSVIEGWGLF